MIKKEEVLERLNITTNEFNLICDIKNGSVTEVNYLNCGDSLLSTIKDNFSNNYDMKWSVNTKELYKKIKELNYKQTLILLNEVDVFWDNNEDYYHNIGRKSPAQALSELLNI